MTARWRWRCWRNQTKPQVVKHQHHTNLQPTIGTRTHCHICSHWTNVAPSSPTMSLQKPGSKEIRRSGILTLMRKILTWRMLIHTLTLVSFQLSFYFKHWPFIHRVLNTLHLNSCCYASSIFHPHCVVCCFHHCFVSLFLIIFCQLLCLPLPCLGLLLFCIFLLTYLLIWLALSFFYL